MSLIFLIVGAVVIVKIVKAIIKDLMQSAKNNYDKELEKKKPYLAQKALDYYLLTEKAFMKNYMPFIEYLEPLEHRYKYNNTPLTEVQLNKYFSYPKLIYLNDKDEVICNGVNLGYLGGKLHPDGNWLIGNSVICPLFKCEKNDTMYESDYNLFKDNDSCLRYIKDCHWTRDFTTYKDLENNPYEPKIPLSEIDKLQDKVYNKEIKRFKDTYEANKGLIERLLPEDLKKTYKEINDGDKTKEEIEKLLVEYYYKSNRNYLLYLKEKGLNEVPFNEFENEYFKTHKCTYTTDKDIINGNYGFGGHYHKYNNEYYSLYDADCRKVISSEGRSIAHGLYKDNNLKNSLKPITKIFVKDYDLKYRY